MLPHFIIYCIGFLCSLVLTLAIMPRLIRYLHKIKFGQTEREEGLESHKSKTGTPTMGGLAFIFVPVVIYLVFALFHLVDLELQIWIVLLAFVGYGLIGFIDDYIIVVQKNNEGLKPKAKFFLPSVLAVVFFILYMVSGASMDLWIPIVNVSIPLGIFYFVLIFIMFTAETNAVNLTDGVDGLCAGQMIIALVPFLIFSLRGAQNNLAFFIVLVIASLLGYLKYNKHPAQIFMGDTGSLALGGLLAGVAMILKQE